MRNTRPAGNRPMMAAAAVLLLAAGGVATGHVEIPLALLATVPLALLLRGCRGDVRPERRLPVASFIAGQLLCWVAGWLAAVTILGAERGYGARHIVVTMVCVNLATWPAALGAAIVFHRGRLARPRPAAFAPPQPARAEMLMVTGAAAVVLLLAGYLAGGVDARYTVGNRRETGSALYFLGGLVILHLPFFFLLGTRLTLPARAPRNLGAGAVLLAGVLWSGLSGGRTLGALMIVAFLAGALWSEWGQRSLRTLLAVGAVATLAFMAVVGVTRDATGFDLMTPEERLRSLGTGGGRPQALGGEWWETWAVALVGRLGEATGQMVIDDAAERDERTGFRNFERLRFLLVPRFVAGEKPPLDDGAERLRQEFGVRITDFTSAPITFIADGYDRGGYAFVAGASLVAGLWLALVGELLAAVSSRPVRLLLLGVVAAGCLQIYARGVLGAASRLTYELGRDLALLAALSAAAAAVGALRVRSRSVRAPALPSGPGWRR